MVLIVACGCGRSTVHSISTGATDDAGSASGIPKDPAVDAGAAMDAGPVADAGGGSAPDAGPATDAGPAPAPATIGNAPCPASPPVLWSRTFSDEVDFRGAADGEGNLYWVEYDPPPTYRNPNAPAWLGSADRDGRNRYRLPIPVASESGVFLMVGDEVVTSNGAVLAAYDKASGATSWSIDLRATYPDGNAGVSSIADLGNGKLAFALNDYKTASGLYLVDAATGAMTWSSVATADTRYGVAGSDGAGSFLAGARYSSSDSTQGYHTEVDLFLTDSSGRQVWSHHITDGGGLLAWPFGAPWLRIAGTQSVSPAGDYVAAPSSWGSAVEGSDFGYSLYSGTRAADPIGVNVTRGGAVIAQGSIPGTSSYNGGAAFPFLAGEAGDHLILLWQNWHANAGLCRVTLPGTAGLSRYDANTSYQCPLTLEGDSAIEGAALLDGRVILGRRALSTSCGYHLQPMTIEAYALPGESLAPSGWVQSGGNPGLGMRPRHR